MLHVHVYAEVQFKYIHHMQLNMCFRYIYVCIYKTKNLSLKLYLNYSTRLYVLLTSLILHYTIVHKYHIIFNQFKLNNHGIIQLSIMYCTVYMCSTKSCIKFATACNSEFCQGWFLITVTQIILNNITYFIMTVMHLLQNFYAVDLI